MYKEVKENLFTSLLIYYVKTNAKRRGEDPVKAVMKLIEEGEIKIPQKYESKVLRIIKS